MYFQTDSELKEKFIKSGILPDQKIAVLCNNSEEYIKLLIQIIFTGGVVVPVSPVIPIFKLHSILRNIGCLKIIVGENINYEDDSLIRSISFKYFDEELNKIDLKKMINGFNIYKSSGSHDRDASIIFTSGSTNMPKAVLHTFNNHWYSAIGSNLNILFQTGDCWMVALPLNHVSGFSTIFKTLAGKADIFVKPSGVTLLESLQVNNSVTHISLIPSQLSELINDTSGVEILKKLKAVLIGGSPAPFKLMEESKNLGLNVYNSYGSTEMSSQITCTIKNDILTHLKTSGKLLKFREIKISSENEILVKGKTLFRGYIKKSNLKNYEIFNQVNVDGWFATGDLGYIDDEGYLHVSGRKDLMFVCNGENIFPEEIENALKEIAEIEDALVVPIGKYEEERKPAAFLKSKGHLKLDYSAISNNLLKKLEYFKIPETYLDWPYDLGKKAIKPDRESYKKRAFDLTKNNQRNN
jgi:O-succinylbenzoic acid--CoA ligase